MCVVAASLDLEVCDGLECMCTCACCNLNLIFYKLLTESDIRCFS